MTERLRPYRILNICLCSAVLLLAGSCRLSEPVYAFKPLRAGQAERPGEALIIGTVQSEKVALYGKVHTVVLERVAPTPMWISASEAIIYRVFRKRNFRRGHFVLVVPPGVWEIKEIRSHGGCMYKNVTWVVSEDTRVASRIFVTRPGIYDIGVLRIGSPSFIGAQSSFAIESGEGDPGRRARFEKAVRGTVWEQYLDQVR